MKKKVSLASILIILLSISSCTSGPTIPPATDSHDDEWQLVWSDEFDGSEINPLKWNYITGAGGYGNNELQYYSDRSENARIEDGKLILQARDDGYQGSPYSSAKLTTEGKGDWLYGRIEVRARLPLGQGIWPAIWMMPTDYGLYGPWPACGEIDLVELVGHEPSVVHGTLHYGLPHTYTGDSYRLSSGTFADDFHDFCMEWEPGEIRWYVDGSLYQTQNDWFSRRQGNPADYTWPAPFDREFYLQLNVAVGGNWPGNPDATTVFPQALEIDYVRVYQKTEGYDPVFPSAKHPEEEETGRPPTADGNYVYNADFAENLEYWEFGNYEGGLGNASWENGSVHIAIEEAGVQTWANQLTQQEMDLQAGGVYRVTFRARAEEPRSIMIKIGGLAPRGWAAYSEEQFIELSTEWKDYQFDFLMSEESDVHARYEFNLGLSDADVWIEEASLRQLDTGGETTSASTRTLLPESRPRSTEGELIYNGTFDLGSTRRDFWVVENVAFLPRISPYAGERYLNLPVKTDLPTRVTQQRIDIKGGEAYLLRFNARSEAPVKLEIQLKDAEGLSLFPDPLSLELTTEWIEFSREWRLPPSMSPGGALIFSATTEQMTRFQLDNVSLVHLPDPMTVGDSLLRIEAEDYYEKSANPQTETCSEGGLNVGWLDPGDWIAFDLEVAEAGTYRIRYRIATDQPEGKITAIVAGKTTPDLILSRTGGWQVWTTLEQEIELPAGEMSLILQLELLNINWIELEKIFR